LTKPSIIDIDDFLENHNDNDATDPLVDLKRAVISDLTYSLVVCLGISDEKESHGAKVVAAWFVKACLSVIYNDPLDILILLKDQVLENNAVVTVIDKMWVVKVRPQQGV
jgi:hypothetical protein